MHTRKFLKMITRVNNFEREKEKKKKLSLKPYKANNEYKTPARDLATVQIFK